MATWQPNITESRKELEEVMRWGALSFNVQADNVMRAILKASGALSEINRLTALLAMKDETIKTLRERVLKDTATFADDYDSGYRAA